MIYVHLYVSSSLKTYVMCSFIKGTYRYTLNFLERHIDRLQMVLGTAAIVFVLAMRYLLLERGMIFSDDAWYFSLIRYNPDGVLTVRFFRLFQFGLQNDIYALRVFSVLMQLAAHILFGYALCRYLRHIGQGIGMWMCMSVLALGSLSIPDLITPNYINLNLVYGLCTMSFLLLWHIGRRWYWLFMCAFSVACIFTSVFTSLVLVPIVYAVVCILSSNRQRDTMVFAMGVLTFAVAYCVGVENPVEIVRGVTEVSHKTIARGSNTYGIWFFVQWCLLSAVYVLWYGLMALILNVTYNRIKGNRTLAPWRGIIFPVVFCILFVIFNYWVGSRPRTYNAWGIPWIFGSLFLMRRYKTLSREQMLLIALFAVTPVVLCLGTNVPLARSQTRYIVFLLPVIFLLTQPTKKMRLMAVACYAGIFMQVAFVELDRGNWFGDRIADQTIHVRELGIDQNIRLSQQNIYKLSFCKQHIPDGAACFFSFDMWGISALLDYKPQANGFRLPAKEVMSERIAASLRNNGEVFVVMSKKEPVEIDTVMLRCGRQEGNGVIIYRCTSLADSTCK